MANPTTAPPSSLEPPRPSLDERAPFFVTEEDLAQFVKENFPPTAEGRAAMRAALAAADSKVRERFRAAGWKLED